MMGPPTTNLSTKLRTTLSCVNNPHDKKSSLIEARSSIYSSNMIPLHSQAKVAYKFNMTGRSIKGGGAQGRSNSPHSHSGFDPDMPRGLSSQLNFEMVASER